MGTTDKASNKAQDLKGKVKAAVGRLVGNRELARQGKADQSQSALKNAGENVKQAVASTKDSVTRK